MPVRRTTCLAHLPVIARAGSQAVMFDRGSETLLDHPHCGAQCRGRPTGDMRVPFLIAANNSVLAVGGPYPSFKDGHPDLFCVHPEPAVIVSPSIGDLNVPSPNQITGLGVIRLKDDLFQMLRTDPRVNATFQSVPII